MKNLEESKLTIILFIVFAITYLTYSILVESGCYLQKKIANSFILGAIRGLVIGGVMHGARGAIISSTVFAATAPFMIFVETVL